MIYSIENSKLKVSINSLGAELFSAFQKEKQVELIWQGDTKYWKGRSPILFPFIGRLQNQIYTYKGQEYSIGLHGFARHQEFKVISSNDTEITFELTDSLDSLKEYPFKFKLSLTYRLVDETLFFDYKVTNLSDDVMIFSLGGHPGINIPFVANTKFEDYYLEFSKASFQKRLMSGAVLDIEKDEEIHFNNNILRLNHSLFDNDAICFKDSNDVLYIKNDVDKSFVKLAFGKITTIGFWHANKTDAPYICVEPWDGFPGRDGVIEKLEEKLETNKLQPNECYINSFNLTFHLE